MDTKKQLEIWSNLWQNGHSNYWIKDHPNEFLWKYIDLLKCEKDEVFLVPCCGNVRDMKLLSDKGYKVVGVEFYEPPVKEFFLQNDLPFITSNTKGHLEYSTPDGRIRIIVGDVLSINSEMIGGPVKAVWDKGGLTSIDKTLRKGFVKTMVKLLNPETQYLLDCYQYNDWYIDIAPRNFPRELIAELLEPHFHVTLLETEERHLEFLRVDAKRALYLMTRK